MIVVGARGRGTSEGVAAAGAVAVYAGAGAGEGAGTGAVPCAAAELLDAPPILSFSFGADVPADGADGGCIVCIGGGIEAGGSCGVADGCGCGCWADAGIDSFSFNFGAADGAATGTTAAVLAAAGW